MTLMKKIEAQKPMNRTVYAMILYSNFLSCIVEKMMSPSPSTVKLLMKVNKFLKLFNLSYDNIIDTLLFREQVREGTKLMWLICREAQPTLNKLGNIV